MRQLWRDLPVLLLAACCAYPLYVLFSVMLDGFPS